MERKILVVDNELKVRDLMYEALKRAGYEVVTATGGGAAIESFRNNKPFLVLLDFKMPDMGGIDVLEKIRSIDPKARVIMLTGLEEGELERRARLAGASGFLRKSLGVDVIVKAVNDVCRPESSCEKEKILIIDDDEGIRSLIGDFLVKKGFTVLSAASGEDGIALTEKEKPILILLDINLPGMDGIVTLKRIREIDQQVGVIMITGVKDQDVFEEAKQLGAYEYIVKPFSLEYLETTVLVRICLVSAQIG
jgi:DNA-binding response OmpR family regulator